MKLNNRSLRKVEAVHPKNESAGPNAAGASPARRRIKFRTPAGTSRGLSKPGLAITGVALCMSLATCVVPDGALYGGSAGVTSYQPGYTVSSLPGGYRQENISGRDYYYHDGQYYRQGSGGYVIVEAPRSSRYYDDYNRRHRNSQSDRRYDQSYERGRRDGLTRLPGDYREIDHRGNTYYQVGDEYYRRQGENFIIVNSPY